MTFAWRRVAALLAKELAELRRNSAAFVPVVILAIVTMTLPFIIVIVLPRALGEPLSSDSDFASMATLDASLEGLSQLSREGAIQAFLFQQFLLVQLLIPVAGATAFAGYSLIGEKQARTLEPLLATPITTTELLVAKGLGALVPSVGIMLVACVVYLGAVGVLAEPGVLPVLLNVKSALLVFGLGPVTSLVALQIGVLVSSRVNDPRTAQQYSAFLILPLTGLFALGLTGAVTMTVPVVILVLLGLFMVWLLLVGLGVVLFDREAILTKWR
jgi:ABC-2 type transport system permease protein